MYWECKPRNAKRGRKQTYCLRFYVFTNDTNPNKRKKTTSFTITDNKPTKTHAHLFSLFHDVQDRLQDGGELSDESKATIRTIQDTDPDRVRKWIDEGWFKTVSCFTLGQACDDYMQHRGQKKLWKKYTWRNYKDCRKRICDEIGCDVKVTDITLKRAEEALVNLRSLSAWSVFEKDFKFLKSVFNYLHDHDDIAKNPLKKLKLIEWKPSVIETQKDEMVELPRFRKVLDGFTEDELQQKCLFGYWRFLGARKFDPIGDHWEDIDFDKGVVHRWCKKKETKIDTGGRGCPIDPEFMPLLIQWRERVIAEKGEATGPIFPWLNHYYEKSLDKAGDDGRVYRYFKFRVERVEDEAWPNLIKSLRSSRSKEYRRLKNGSFLESIWIGHSEEVAEKHYDGLLESDLDLVRATSSKGEAA